MDEIKIEVAKRVPPGDKWRCIYDGANTDDIKECLTDVLETIYQDLGVTKFYIDARDGYVYSVSFEEREIISESDKRYSLYGEY